MVTMFPARIWGALLEVDDKLMLGRVVSALRPDEIYCVFI
jgi:hypothetical protein